MLHQYLVVPASKPSFGTAPCSAAVQQAAPVRSTRALKPTEYTNTGTQRSPPPSSWQEFALVAYTLRTGCSHLYISYGLAASTAAPSQASAYFLSPSLAHPSAASYSISRFRGAKQAGFFVGSRRACLAPIKPAIHVAASRSSILLPSPICHSPRQLELATTCNV